MNKLIKEYKLSTAELKKRVELRDGEKYQVRKKGGRPKGSAKKRGPGRPAGAQASKLGAEELISVMDGRTNTATLLKIAYRVNELLDAKPKAEVQKIEKAVENAEKFREQYQEALALIGDEIPI